MEKAKAVQRAAGKLTGMTGRDMFMFGGELYEDEEEGDDDWDISRMLARYVSERVCAARQCLFCSSKLTEELLANVRRREKKMRDQKTTTGPMATIQIQIQGTWRMEWTSCLWWKISHVFLHSRMVLITTVSCIFVLVKALVLSTSLNTGHAVPHSAPIAT